MDQRDVVTLVSANGIVKIDKLPCLFQPTLLYTTDKLVPFEVGDRIIRDLPNGLAEEFEVINPKYYDIGTDSHFQVVIRRTNLPATDHASIVNIISGNNARLNINSVDSSSNIAVVANEDLFEQLIERSKSPQIPEVTQKQLLLCIEMMKSSQGHPSFSIKYKDFVQAAANHMTIFAPLIPALTVLL